jgi:RNA polymerase sigma-70 factor (ECF subfamily)
MSDQQQENATPHTPSASSLEDLKWVNRASAGDQAAFASLMTKYHQPLYFHVLRMVHYRDLVEDLLQEIFTKAFDNIHSFNPSYAFSTWLYRIATNHTIDHLRKKRLRTMSLDEPIQTKDGEMKLEVADDSEFTDEGIQYQQRAKIIREAIDLLPPRYKEVIQMRHMEEKSYQEIAEMLDLPLGTVKAHIFRARELLYKHLKDREGSF